MRTENLEILSKDTTGNLAVATACRMSMSLPLVYYPVLVNGFDVSGRGEKFWDGLWVDGGLFDNAPVRYFDPSSTLLLRLGGREANNEIKSLSTFLRIWLFNMGALGSGGGQTTHTTFKANQVIQLDVRHSSGDQSIGLLEFNLDQKEFDDLTKRNEERVNGYFKAS